MAKRALPSHATFYVAHAVANDVLIKLALSFAANLAVTAPDEREAEGSTMVDNLLEAFLPAADFKTEKIAATLPGLGPYDADEAEAIALDIVGDAMTMIRQRTIG